MRTSLGSLFKQTETEEDWQTNIQPALEQIYPRLEVEVPGPVTVPAKQVTDWLDHIKLLSQSVSITDPYLAIYRWLSCLTFR